MSEAARKSWVTRKRRKTGFRVSDHRNQLMVEVKDLLKEWYSEVEGKGVCAVCGDGLPRSILQTHHVNPFDKSEGTVLLCGSCHNIFNKAKETTKTDDIMRDFKLRRKRFASNLRDTT